MALLLNSESRNLMDTGRELPFILFVEKWTPALSLSAELAVEEIDVDQSFVVVVRLQHHTRFRPGTARSRKFRIPDPDVLCTGDGDPVPSVVQGPDVLQGDILTVATTAVPHKLNTGTATVPYGQPPDGDIATHVHFEGMALFAAGVLALVHPEGGPAALDGDILRTGQFEQSIALAERPRFCPQDNSGLEDDGHVA